MEEDPKRNLTGTLDKVAMELHPSTPPPNQASTSAEIFSTDKVVKTPAAVFSIVTGMIKEKLHLQDYDTTEIEKQLQFYFN